jgi:ppGpp synthetase/RelA/SpoT-type nucleotidyltranferase
MIDLEPIRERWIADRPVYTALAEHIRTLLKAELQRRGLLCSVDARPKEVASLLKKVLRKSYSAPYEDIHDKAGIRVVVSFAADVATVEEVIRQRFRVERYENKTRGLDYRELGYLGVHFDVSLLEGDAARGEWRGLISEIQVHTRAQNCWADVSHHLLYKPAQEAPLQVKRRIYRLMALVELFDESVQEARKVIEMLPGAPEARVLSELEQHFYQFAARPYDRELSFDIIGALERLYDAGERDGFGELMRRFVESNHAKLVELFAAYRDDDRCNPLLFQPEALMVFERLERDPFRLREAWTASFPLLLLENLAMIWGRAV